MCVNGQRGQRLKDEFNRHTEMLLLLLRYTQSLITQLAQTAVYNRHHSIDQQLYGSARLNTPAARSRCWTGQNLKTCVASVTR